MKTICVLTLCFFPFHFLAAQQTDGRMILNFEQAGRMAVAASPELRQLRAQRALREGAWALSLRAFLPQLGIVISEDDRLSQISADSFTKNYSINLEQLVFDGGRTRTSRKIERAELNLLAGELKQNEAAVTDSAVSMYHKILLSQMFISIREAALVSLNEQRRILAEELALGMVIPLDLVQAEITVREAELELLAMKIQEEELEKQFAELLGLEALPEFSEKIDIYRSAVIPGKDDVRRSALARNPALRRIILAIMQKEAEAKYASRSWIPTIKGMVTYSVSGQHYPLNRQSLLVGLSLSFSSPFLSVSTMGNTGWEFPYDRTARMQGSVSPLPDPVSSMGAKQASLALVFEYENYLIMQQRLERQAVLEVENLHLNEERRMLAVESLKLGAEKYRLSEVLLSLGRITRVELMEQRLEFEKKEMLAAEAAAALLEAERSIERILDIAPGSLNSFFGRVTQ